jgi:phage gp46-like protein
LGSNDLAGDDGLETAVMLSLFTDARADGERGWWGDAYAAVEGDAIGSTLWQLARGKHTPQALNQARAAAEAALAWLVEDGVAERVMVTVETPRADVLGLVVEIHRPHDPPVRYRFEDFWNRQ